MSDKSKESPPPNHCGHDDMYCKVLSAFLALSSYLIFQIIDITSRHYAVAFKIPIHNIGIFFDKLFSLRVLLILAGNMIEYGIFHAAGADRDTGDGDKNKGKRVRRYIAVTAFAGLFCVRVWFLAGLYFSKELGYHAYVSLSFEGFPFGISDSAFMPLIAQYMSVVAIMFNMTRIFIFVVQFILDRIWYDNPLLMIKIQAWICVLFTGCSVFLWYYFNFVIKDHTFKPPKIENAKEPEIKKQEYEEIEINDAESIFDMLIDLCFSPDEKKEKEKQKVNQQSKKSDCNALCQDCKKRVGKDGIFTLISPLMMYWCLNPYMTFLFPGTVPYALLKRDKCHRINMFIPIFDNLGTLTLFFIDNFGKLFPCWSWHYDLFLLLLVPFPIIFVFALMAMHSRVSAARKIISNRTRVGAMTLVMYFSNSFCTPLHYIGMAKYSFRGNPYGFTIQGLQKVIGGIARSFWAKVSVGYSVTRISLGYHLPKFRPNHRMSKSNLGWYIFRQTFRKTWADFKGDFVLDMKKYL
ncbi:conserved hypothetical protein [Theileria orientalis strain Shintoku]|uniref:Uncharacterized protein n=1 Tax=Theileria orientalis strain Shintoku TaxID=869250 RepID=J7MGJ2_THEOR|nr:conserved hypothetical protein [Theileria orientalis strain Shintoku]BAM38536.1 conserved hypothetical protein [Theileria orientalis strain Shintoku]|eukprot:XP_009688837.1 conserved hypothetical protein [Theileria orientalis strain Shintoku]